MIGYRYILLWLLLGMLPTAGQAASRCFEGLLGGPDESCHHGPLRSKVSMRQLMCDFKLECPEHNRAIEWQDMPALANLMTQVSTAGATNEDLARWYILRAKHFLFIGNYVDAELACSNAVLSLSGSGDQVLFWYALYFQGMAWQHIRAYEQANESFGEALAIASNISDDRYRLYSLYAISNLKELEGDHGRALEYYREFHRLHQLLNLKSEQIRAQRDSVFLAAMNEGINAGTVVWQWAFWVVLMFLFSVFAGLYFWPLRRLFFLLIRKFAS